jgi:hypothetical protein
MKKFAFACLLIAGALWAQDWDQTLQNLAAPTVQGTLEAKDWKQAWGNAAFTFNGTCARVAAGPHTIGFLFSGTGTMALAVPDRIALSAAKVNLKEAGSYALDASNTLHETFTEGFFIVFPFLDGALFQGDGAPGADRLKEYQEITKWMGQPTLDFILAPALFNGYKGPQVMAFIKGSQEKNLLYYLDANEEMKEYLFTYKKSRYQPEFYQLNRLVTSPTGWDWNKRRIWPVYQTGVDMEFVSKDNVSATQKAAIEFTPTVDGVRVLSLSMSSGQSKEYKLWDDRADPIAVKRITGPKGENIPFAHKFDAIILLLPAPTKKGQPVVLTFESEGAFLKNYYGDSYMVLGNWDWYPTLDFYAQASRFHTVVKVKAPWVPIACGKLVKEWKEGDLNCLESDEKEPMSFPFVIVGEYTSQEFKEGPYLLRLHSYVKSKDKGAAKMAKNGLAALDFYSNGMVPFPYNELDAVEIPYYRHGFWQAPAGIVEFTSEGTNPWGNSIPEEGEIQFERFAALGLNARFAHELAHQWWGNLVSWSSDLDSWLSESWAEYTSFLFMSKFDKKKAKEQFSGKYGWINNTASIKGRGTVVNSALLDFDEADEVSMNLLYSKGPLVLHALRKEMGDQAFFTLYKKFPEACQKMKIKATTEDLIQFVNAITKKDYRPFFDKYIYGTEVPEVKE